MGWGTGRLVNGGAAPGFTESRGMARVPSRGPRLGAEAEGGAWRGAGPPGLGLAGRRAGGRSTAPILTGTARPAE